MFLHLVETKDIALKDVIAILDIDSFNNAECNIELLRHALINGRVEKLSDEESKSVIIANVDGKQVVYFSPFSSITLYKRAYIVDELNIL
ncbi:hypothetical protein SAMN02746089_01678 [Caldanaerobius fijiensis DSM 17918]|uniref:DUF370 domain-containing protein n=1 Tax=Caldanaerobius fijiensis DSM 17918 TaxID=1121256 RepID=A0A1M5AP21_9THEO|nr:hypothetical protein [Caldanaerobius fijiensis]SHF31652.1 hypothetical protein SAMN02746089_01678 [Caldanaerobius fijiensis DSM 17918]